MYAFDPAWPNIALGALVELKDTLVVPRRVNHASNGPSDHSAEPAFVIMHPLLVPGSQVKEDLDEWRLNERIYPRSQKPPPARTPKDGGGVISELRAPDVVVVVIVAIAAASTPLPSTKVRRVETP